MSRFDVQHQDRAYRLVQRALFAERLPHAYIFHGPDGVGKETFARGLATLLLCAEPQSGTGDDGQPTRTACGQCSDCRTAGAGNHPDLHLVYRQLIKYHDDPVVRRRKGLDLGVDVVRQFVIDKVGSKPLRGRAKVFIIREADRITIQAQNALLKTLEEPPDTTFLILLVSSLDRLLPTTRSRCHLTPFGALPTQFIVDELSRRVADIPPERAALVARFSAGSLGLALRHAEDRLDEHNEQLVDLLTNLPNQSVAQATSRLTDQAKNLGKHYSERDADITDTEAQRRGLKALFALGATWYRDLIHVGLASPDLVANSAGLDRLAAATSVTTPGRCAAAIKQLADAEGQLDANVNTKLCLDNLVIRLTGLAGSSRTSSPQRPPS
ncbi:MAG: DNA polymerase III subunit [bacterium]|nr:DNA polymerase III subunit [bacterium]